MPLPDRAGLVVLLGALAMAGCGGDKGTSFPKRPVQVAPTYVARDDDQVRRLAQYQDLLTLAAADLGAGNLDEAHSRASRARRLVDDQPDALVLLAAIADRRGDAADAGAQLARAAEMAPQRGDVLNNYGAWLCQQGRYPEGLSWLARAQAAPGYPTPAVAMSNAGACALRAGDPLRAEQDLRAALARAPRDTQALEGMARISFDKGAFMEARAFSERRLAAASATRSVLQLASQIETRLGDPRAAERYQQRVRQEFPQEAGTTQGLRHRD